MTVGRDPQAETRTRRALDAVLVILNSLIDSGDLVLTGPGRYKLVPPAQQPVVLFQDQNEPDIILIPGPQGPTGATGATGASGAGGGTPIYCPDLAPSSANAGDDEFSTGALDTGVWTDWDVGAVMTSSVGDYGLKLVQTGVAGESVAGIHRPVPVGDFSVITKVSIASIGTNFTSSGIILAEDIGTSPSTGKVIHFAPHYETTNSLHLRVNYFNNYASFNSTLLDTTLAGHEALYLRVRRISTTYYYDYSTDGLNWVQAFSNTPAFTVVKVGLGTNNNHSGGDVASTYFRFWRQLSTTNLDEPLQGNFSSTKGATGAQGPAGMPGRDGEPGEDGMPVPGPMGPAGAAGATGAQGPTGPALFLIEEGPPGNDGIPGTNGVNGTNGATGAQGPPGPALFLIEEGPPGNDGIPGTNGATGATGATGAQGPPGAMTFSFEDVSPGDAGYVGFPQQVSSGPVDAIVSDNGTNNAPVALTIGHDTTGTPAATFGTLTLWTLQDSTTLDNFAAAISVQWVDATHASRKASFSIGVFDTASREIIRGQASGSAPMIGFLGAAATAAQASPDLGTDYVARGLATGTPTFAGANLTGTVCNAYVILEDQKTSGTQGGTFTSGAWQTRTLQTKVVDTGSICTLATNQFTLPAGTYRVRAWAMTRQVNGHQMRIQNVTDSTTAVTGSSNFCASTDNQGSAGLLSGRFTISGTKTFELQHQCSNTVATSGFGIANSFGTEVYAHVEIEKEAT